MHLNQMQVQMQMSTIQMQVQMQMRPPRGIQMQVQMQMRPPRGIQIQVQMQMPHLHLQVQMHLHLNTSLIPIETYTYIYNIYDSHQYLFLFRQTTVEKSDDVVRVRNVNIFSRHLLLADQSRATVLTLPTMHCQSPANNLEATHKQRHQFIFMHFVAFSKLHAVSNIIDIYAWKFSGSKISAYFLPSNTYMTSLPERQTNKSIPHVMALNGVEQYLKLSAQPYGQPNAKYVHFCTCTRYLMCT